MIKKVSTPDLDDVEAQSLASIQLIDASACVDILKNEPYFEECEGRILKEDV